MDGPSKENDAVVLPSACPRVERRPTRRALLDDMIGLSVGVSAMAFAAIGTRSAQAEEDKKASNPPQDKQEDKQIYKVKLYQEPQTTTSGSAAGSSVSIEPVEIVIEIIRCGTSGSCR